jgi:hypothetical protein
LTAQYSQPEHRRGGSRPDRDIDTNVRKKPEEIYDNSFVNNLEKGRFLKEIWGEQEL